MSGAVTAVAIGSAVAVGASLLGNMMAPDVPKPTPAPLPPAPTMDSAATTNVMDKAAQDQQASMQRGRTSTILNGGQGISNLGDTTSKQLLGA